MLDNFKNVFSNTYQDIYNKTNLYTQVGNFRLEPSLTSGGSVTRVAMDFSAVMPYDVVRGAASTINTLTDTAETLLVNIEREIPVHISDGEVTQTGPLMAMQKAGKELAEKLANDLDGKFFAEVRNAAFTFDDGDLSGTTSSGTPITLSNTTVPDMVAFMGAKMINRNNVSTATDSLFVVDAYAAAKITRYIMEKNIDWAGMAFKNGYLGTVATNAQMYISENLASDAVITTTGAFSNGETIVINGVTFTMVSSIGTTPGNVLIGANVAASLTNLAGMINNPTTTSSTQVALTDSLAIFNTEKLVATAGATTLTLAGTGTGRLFITETCANASVTKNYINAYFGKKGGIDIVVQDFKEVDMRPTADRRGTNIFSSYLAGIKTFADGAKRFLNVQISTL